ncbi:MAG: hypothetical protein H0V81_07535, partial [Solirubrobacterales bacterium]|nr:hypothetical protein [Solirubrobacterales bacterium]
MRWLRETAAGTSVLLCAVLSACGGGTKDTPPLGDPAQAAAVASVERLAKAVDDGDAAESCRSLTLASRRVIGLTGAPGATCSKALEEFLVVYGLRRTLPDVEKLRAEVSGRRAIVRGEGLETPLTTTKNGGGWRVSLIQLPGVRADVTAAEACGRYLKQADDLGLPPFDPGPLAARLRSEARLIDGLRRRLDALPSAGPARLGLPDVLDALATVRAGLRAQARRVQDGGSVPRAVQSTARADQLVRSLLGEEGSKARIACPLDVTKGPELAARRTILDAACNSFAATIDRLDTEPATVEGARRLLEAIDSALGRFDARLRRAPVAPRLRRLRIRARGAVASLREQV